MRNSKKKSPAKSKKKSKKNPLKKYQVAGPVVTPTPALGSSSFSPTGSFGTGTLGTSGFSTGNNTYGFNTGSMTGGAPSSSGYLSGNYTPGSTTFNNLYGGYDSGLDTTLNTRTLQDFSEDTNFGQRKDSDASTLDALKPKPKQMTKGEIATTALGAVPGTVGAIANLASSSKIDDPSNYYDKKTRGELERYNKKIKASSAASAVGSGLLATSGAWGPLAFIPAAAGAITMAASEGAKASYQAKQGNLGKSYDERVADRIAYKQRQADKRQQNLDRYSNMNYYGAGSGLARDGGLPKMKSGGPMLMEKYGVGGLSRVHGPTHEQGGIPVAFNSDPQDGGPQIVPEESGMAEGELENNEVIDQTPITQEILREGGVKSGTYMFSEHVGVDGKKGKNKKSLSYADARGKVEKMNLPRDMKKNVIRDLMNRQAEDTNKPERFGSADKISRDGGFMEYQYGGSPKPIVKPEAMSRKDATKMRSMEDTWGARFEEGAKARRLYNKIERINQEKNAAAMGTPMPGSNYYKNGGLPKYQSGSYTVQSGDTLSGIAQAQGIADYNEIYNLNKALIGADPGRIQPGQVLTMPGAASTSTPAATSAWSSAPMSYTAGTGPLGASPLSGYPGFGAGTLTGSGKRPAKPPVKDKSTGEFNKYAPYGIAALGAAGQIATISAMNAKEGVDPLNVASIPPRDQIYLPSVEDPTKGGRESERRAMLRDINTGTGPGKAGKYQQARIGLMREEERMALGINKLNADIRQAEAFKNAERKDTTAYKNAEIVYKNAVSARNEALRLLESKNNKLKAYGDVVSGMAKDTLQYYAMEEQTKAAAGDTRVMNRFYANNYEKFAKKYQKENKGASAHDTYVAFTSQV